MSKKMLKRSLALGALMAFVITGSAMAADLGNYELKGSDKTWNDYYSDGNQENSYLYAGQKYGELESADYEVGVIGTGIETIKFVGTGNKDSQIALGAYTQNPYATKAKASIQNVKDIVVSGSWLHGTGFGNVFIAQGKVSEVDIDITGSITTDGMLDKSMVFHATDGGLLTVDAKEINTLTNDNSVVAQAGHSDLKSRVTLTAESITLKSTTSSTVRSFNNNAYIKLDATVGDLKVLSDESNAVYSSSNDEIILTAAGGIKVESGTGYAIRTEDPENKYNGGATVTVDADGVVDIDGELGAIKALNNGTVNVTGSSIDIDVETEYEAGYVEAVRAGISTGKQNNNGTVNLTATNNIDIDVTGKYVTGIIARGQYGAGNGAEGGNSQGGVVTVNADTLKIKVDGSESGTGIWAANGSTEADGSKVATITINAKNTTIEATSSAISNHSQGIITINNNLTATAPYVLDTRGDAVTNINTDGKGVVNLTGDILFGYATNSGTKIDAKVDLVLSDGSKFEGKIVKDISAMSEENQAKAEMTTVNGMKISLNKGATWNLTGASIVNNATFGADSKLEIDGATFEESNNVYALNGTGSKDTLTIEKGAKLVVNNIDEKTYNIATGFETVSTDKWDIDNLNALMEGEWKETNGLQLVVSAKEVNEIASDTGISESTATLVESIIQNADSDAAKVEGSPEKAAVDFINNVVANNPTSEAVGEAINSATKMAEAGGNSATAASIVKNVTGVTNDRLSFNCGHSAPHKGGHGVGLFEEDSGADIWVEYVHGKDKVEDMPSSAGATSYEGQFNGFVMGVDFKKVNKFQSGIAFNYGEGDTNSVGSAARTHSDYDFWGVGYYGNIHNDDSNVIFDINYAKTDSDVTQNNSTTVFEASPETTTWTAGVKVEKLYQNENVQIVPYTGLRYMSIDSDDYSTKCGAFNYSMERQDIWLLPLGVSIRQEIANDNGWTVSPRVDLSYIWAFGDTNSNMEVKSPFSGVSQLGYDVMDDGSVLGLVGIEAHKGQWGFGVSYSYQKGDHSESKKWFIDANYSL